MKANYLSTLAILLYLIQAIPALATEDPVQVTIEELGSKLFFPIHSAPATTVSLNNSGIGAEISGQIMTIPARVGDTVAVGDLLVELDCRDAEIQLQRAQAALTAAQARVTLAQRQLTRTQSLRKERNISEELFNQREADLKTSRADLISQHAAVSQAELDVTRCQITAPFSGVVTERLASEGEWISPGQPLVRLLDNQRLEVSAQLQVDQVSGLRPDTAYTLKTNGVSHELKLRHLVPVIDSRARNREIRLEFRDTRALPGSSGRLEWQSATGVVPADLPMLRDGELGLLLARDGKAFFHPLPDAREGQPAAVELPPTTLVIIEGRHSLSDGDPIVTGDR